MMQRQMIDFVSQRSKFSGSGNFKGSIDLNIIQNHVVTVTHIMAYTSMKKTDNLNNQ